MSSRHPVEVIHGDPLSPATRKARRSLLAFSTVGIILSTTGIFPSEISALGFTVAEADASVLLTVCGIVILYFLCAFLLYAFPDVWVWRSSAKLQLEGFLQERLVEPLRKSEVLKVPASLDLCV